MTTLINCTSHDVTVIQAMERQVTIRPSGLVARVEIIELPITQAYVDGMSVEITRTVPARVVDLPEPAPGVWYIVSSVVAEHLKDRRDLVVPRKIKRREGRVLGCRLLVAL